MSWIVPHALWLLLLMPLLLLARRRQPRRRVAVGNLYLWSQAASRQTTSLSASLRRHWLLLLQCAIVAALAAAVARPLVPFGGGLVAIVIDDSMSMGARDGDATRLDRARTRALELIDSIPRGTRVQVWRAGGDAASLGVFSRGDAALSAALAGIRLTDATSDLDDAIRRANAADAAPARVHVISDLAPRVSGKVIWSQVGTPADNVALTNVAIARQPAGGIELVATTENYGAAPQATGIAINTNGVVLASARVSIAPRHSATTTMTLPNDTTGIVTARLLLDDALAADNTRLAAVPDRAAVRVLNLVASRYVDRALAADPNLFMASAAGGATRDADVVIASGSVAPAGVAPDAGVLLVSETPRRDQPAAAVTVVAPAHPIVASVAFDRLTLSPIEGPVPSNEQAVLVRAGAAPLLLAYERDNRRVVELRADLADPSFTLDAAFPMLLANTIEWLSAPRRDVLTLTAGQPLRVSRGDNAQAPALIGPDGQPLSGAAQAGDAAISVLPTAGLYRLGRDANAAGVIVNPATAAESDLAIESGPTIPPPGGAALTSSLETEATSAMLLLGVVLLAAEWRQRHRPGGRG